MDQSGLADAISIEEIRTSVYFVVALLILAALLFK